MSLDFELNEHAEKLDAIVSFDITSVPFNVFKLSLAFTATLLWICAHYPKERILYLVTKTTEIMSSKSGMKGGRDKP